tara:strand:- start:185 stop:343 length:159 start_codon:yes stop_codon:yes gene_type:complete
MDELIHYRVWVNEKTNSVRLEATGFTNEEDAMEFANWLSELPFDDVEEQSVH